MTDDASDPPPHDPLVDLTDEVRVTAAIEERQHRHALRAQAEDTGTLVGTLHDLAEAAAGVSLRTTSDRRYQGRLVAVAADHVVLVTRRQQSVYVMLDRIAVARPEPVLASVRATGDREPAQDLLLLERCADWVDDRPWLVVAVVGPSDLLGGHLHAVGEDVVTLRRDNAGPSTFVVARAIEAITRS